MERIHHENVEQHRFVVTGGTEGIGRAISRELVDQNHRVAICARKKEGVEAAKNSNENIIAEQIDLADTDAAKDFLNRSITTMGGLDVLILNAGVTGLKEPSDYVYKVNEVANVALSESAIEALRKNGGTIVFMTSETAHTDLGGGIEAYRVSKMNMEKWLSDFSKNPENANVKIFSVNPGSVDTRMHQEVVTYGTGDIKARTEQKIADHKLRDPNIVGSIISKMAIGGNKYNPNTNNYDIPIKSGEVVVVTDENIEFERDKT